MFVCSWRRKKIDAGKGAEKCWLHNVPREVRRDGR